MIQTHTKRGLKSTINCTNYVDRKKHIELLIHAKVICCPELLTMKTKNSEHVEVQKIINKQNGKENI